MGKQVFIHSFRYIAEDKVIASMLFSRAVG